MNFKSRGNGTSSFLECVSCLLTSIDTCTSTGTTRKAMHCTKQQLVNSDMLDVRITSTHLPSVRGIFIRPPQQEQQLPQPMHIPLSSSSFR
mmetsp:Transcript_12075/g.24986  ORF Transcript_12075/g.24986 Transcript_12075/m.24986 type:complete len:91 (+) Transcript_12075:200-472(+)